MAGNQALSSRIGKKKQLSRVQAQDLRQSGNYFLGRMALFCLKVADIGNRGPNSASKLFLSQVELTPPRTNYGTKALNVSLLHVQSFWHLANHTLKAFG